MATLALSTSSPLQSVAIAENGVVLAQAERRFARREPRRLLVDIEAVMAEASVGWQDIRLLAADLGPGSFTGIRAGLATLRALAFAHDIPCVGLPATQLVDHACLPTTPVDQRAAWIALPSRSTTCFVAPILADGRVGPADEHPYASFSALVPAGAMVCAIAAVQVAVEKVAPDHVVWIDASEPNAATLALMAPMVQSDAGVDGWQTLVPYYVAASDAERNTGVYVEAQAIPAHVQEENPHPPSTISPVAAT